MENIIIFFKKEVLKKDFLMPIRILAVLLFLLPFIKIGWLFIKTCLLIIIGSISQYQINGTSQFAFILAWWLHLINICACTYSLYFFITQLNKRGWKKLLAILPIVGVILYFCIMVIIGAAIDQYTSIPLINTMTIINIFLFSL